MVQHAQRLRDLITLYQDEAAGAFQEAEFALRAVAWERGYLARWPTAADAWDHRERLRQARLEWVKQTDYAARCALTARELMGVEE